MKPVALYQMIHRYRSLVPKMPKKTKFKEMLSIIKIKIYESYSSKDLSTTTPTSKDTKEKSFMEMSGDFKDIRPMPAFVDKTMLLDTIMEKKHRFICLTAPRRFGKSVNLSMLKRFWEALPDEKDISKNRKLFDDTEIEKECSDLVKEHCGKYPIIFLNFQSTIDKITCYGSVLERLRTVVHEAYKKHAYLKRSYKLDSFQRKIVKNWCNDLIFKSIPISSEEIDSALKNLAEYLVKHHRQQVIVLVDEYDSICSYAIMNVRDIKEDQNLPDGRRVHKATNEIHQIIALCIGSIGCLLKENENVFRGVITGVSYLTTMGLSPLNNICPYRFQDIHDFTPFYGITSEELKVVLKNVSMVSKYDEIMINFNGYRGEMLSTWSVMRYLNDRGNREDKNYWAQSGIVIGVSDAFRITGVRSVIYYLMSNRSNKLKIIYSEKTEPDDIVNLKNVLSSSTEELNDRYVDLFLNFLLEQGYLKRSIMYEDKTIEVQIPNLEVKSELLRKLESFYVTNFRLDATLAKKCAALFDEFSKNKDDNMKLLKEIKVVLNKFINTAEFVYPKEACLHHVIYHTLHKYSEEFLCATELGNRSKKEGVLDLILLSKSKGIGIIIELKVGGKAREALEQIVLKNYRKAFVDYKPEKIMIIDYSIFIGLNMDKEHKVTLHVLLNSDDITKAEDVIVDK